MTIIALNSAPWRIDQARSLSWRLRRRSLERTRERIDGKVWKKWGIYALAAAIVVSTIISILAGQMVSGIISLLIGGVLLWYVTKDKMAWFS